jgi:hypothetical protein
MTLSTPGVRFPLLVTTLSTAKSLAAIERVRTHWRKETLPQRFSLAAFAIRTCSRRTWRSSWLHSMEFQFLSHVGIAPASGKASASFCSLPFRIGSACSLAKKDQSDVCSLSCRVTLKPVSAPLQDGIRFFRPPKPAPPLSGLAAILPVEFTGEIRGFLLPPSEVRRVRYLLSTGKLVDYEVATLNPPTCLRAFWLKLVSHV